MTSDGEERREMKEESFMWKQTCKSAFSCILNKDVKVTVFIYLFFFTSAMRSAFN